MASAKQHKPQRSEGKCPICGSPAEQAYRPFCSSRCANVDLSRWLRGGYVIEGRTADDDEDGDSSRPSSDSGITRNEDPSEN